MVFLLKKIGPQWMQHSKKRKINMLKILRLAAATTALVVGVTGLATAESHGNATTHEIAPGVYSFDSGSG